MAEIRVGCPVIDDGDQNGGGGGKIVTNGPSNSD